jgi:hypothetical protein
MSDVSGRARRTRILAVAAVLLVHWAVLSLIAVERHTSRTSPAPELQYVSLWPQVRTEPETAERPPQQEASARSSSRPLRAISEHPVPSEGQPLRPSDSANPRAASVSPPTDWSAAAADAVVRIGQAGGEQKDFSPAPVVRREPCKPRVFDEDTKQLMEDRLPAPADPDLVGENPTASCIIVGGFPKCVQKITGKKKQPLQSFEEFGEDRRVGKKAGTSAPSLETCE